MWSWLAEAATLPLGVGTTAGLFSLSSTIQRRILAYLLRRFLGHLLLDPDAHFDDASLDAALLASGRVEVRNLSIDPDAINALPATPSPIKVHSGNIARIAIQLPWPNLWSGQLSVHVDGPDVAVMLCRGQGSSSSLMAHQQPTTHDDEEGNEDQHLAGSVMFQSVLHDVENEPEIAAALRGAARANVAASSSPSSGGSTPSTSASAARPAPAFARPAPRKAGPAPTSTAAPTTTTSSMIQGIVDSLLSRLQVSVHNARVTILPSDHQGQESSRVPPCQLCFDSASFSLNANEDTKGSGSSAGGSGGAASATQQAVAAEVVRNATLRGVSLWLLPTAPTSLGSSTPSSSSSDIGSSKSSIGSSENSSDSGGPRTSKTGAQRVVHLPLVELGLRQIAADATAATATGPDTSATGRASVFTQAAVVQTEITIPNVRLSVNRSIVVGLQLVADDFTQWSNSLPPPPATAAPASRQRAASGDDDGEDDGVYEQEGLSSSSSQSTEVGGLGSSLMLELAKAARSRDDAPAMDMTQSLVGLPPPSHLGASRLHGQPQLGLQGRKARPAVSQTTIRIGEAFLDADIPRQVDEHRLRHFRIRAEQVEVIIHPRSQEKRTLTDMRVGGLEVEEVAENRHAWLMLQRAPPKALFAPRHPIVKLHLVTFADPTTNYRESKMALHLDDIVLSLRADPSVLDDVARFVVPPAGAFEQMEPNEITRVSVRISNAAVSVVPCGARNEGSRMQAHAQAQAPAHGRLVLTLADAHARLKLMPRAEETPVHVSWKEATVLILDRVPVGEEGGARLTGATSSRAKAREGGMAEGLVAFWKAQGFAPVLTVRNFVSDLTLHKSTKPAVELSVTRGNVNGMLCADTLSAVIALSQAISADMAARPPEAKAERAGDNLTESQTSTTTSRHTGILGSVEEDAFVQAPMIASIPDLLEDDIPHDPSFVGTQTESPKLQEIDLSGSDFFGEGAIAAVPAEPAYDPKIVSVADGVTVRLLHPDGIRPRLDYFAKAALQDEAGLRGTSNMRIRCSRLNITLGLYAGYDWKVTRRALEEEARRVRRRLQKIKQLLAEGQEPDDSVEQAMSSLTESVHLTRPEGAAAMDDAAQALEALRNEFGDELLESEAAASAVGDGDETASTASTWQPLPNSAKARPQPGPSAGSGRRRTTKLERSAQSMIDINIRGIAVAFDTFDEAETLSSRLAVSAKKVEIIDNIKTSTWRTFLTELLPEGRTTHRDANARMLRLLVENERAAAREHGYEAKLRLKLAPLRLHVDQDALDFLKAFFAFKVPGAESGAQATGSTSAAASSTGTSAPTTATPPTTTTPASEPHIQVADVHAVRLKLDYKPKRVDYGQLRQGRTMELMNFFHFDGADMTLRHVTLRGIAGWPRFFEALNDIWTPDVKANQLADVLAGIAPIRTVVNVGAGLADLVLLPLEQYQKDGRLVKGLGRGLGSFARTATLEAVKLSAQLATGTQVILERAEHVLGGRMSGDVRAEAVVGASSVGGGGQGASGGGPASTAATASASTSISAARRPVISRPRLSDERIDPVGRGLGAEHEDEAAPLSKYARPPENMRDALAQAYAGLRRGAQSAAQTILAVPMEVYESPGGGAAQPVIRAVPIAILQGALGASEAVSKTLLGLQHAMNASAEDSEGKYK